MRQIMENIQDFMQEEFRIIDAKIQRPTYKLLDDMESSLEILSEQILQRIEGENAKVKEKELEKVMQTFQYVLDKYRKDLDKVLLQVMDQKSEGPSNYIFSFINNPGEILKKELLGTLNKYLLKKITKTAYTPTLFNYFVKPRVKGFISEYYTYTKHISAVCNNARYNSSQVAIESFKETALANNNTNSLMAFMRNYYSELGKIQPCKSMYQEHKAVMVRLKSSSGICPLTKKFDKFIAQCNSNKNKIKNNLSHSMASNSFKL